MTCIAGVVSNGKVWIGGDSAGVNDAGDLQLRKDPKVFKNGEYLIGVSGSWRVNQAIKFYKMEHILPEGGDAFKHMVKVFLPTIQYLARDVEKDFELLVGFRGRLFHIYGLSQVSEEMADYAACGSGAQVARGALFSSFESEEFSGANSPEDRLTTALRAAERFCSGVRGPFVIESI